jgi:nuclear transport factor 2 (NTF2) superfamily protein
MHALQLPVARFTQGSTTQKQQLIPPFTEETARLRMQAAEDAWNTSDPDTIAREYTADTQWRRFNGQVFIRGVDEVKPFLTTKFKKQKQYSIKKEFFAHTDDGIALSCEFSYCDAVTGQWFSSYGCEFWTLDKNGCISIMDLILSPEEQIEKK